MNIVLPLERLAVLTESSCGEFPEESGVGRFCYGKLDFVLFPMFMVDKVRKEIILAFMVMGFFLELYKLMLWMITIQNRLYLAIVLIADGKSEYECRVIQRLF